MLLTQTRWLHRLIFVIPNLVNYIVTTIIVTFQPNYGDEGLFIVTRQGSNLFGRIGSTARSTVFHCPSVATFFKFTDAGGSDITNVAQKPMALMDAFLRWTQPGDVIADFGAGSGSLLSAAICGRHGGRSGIVKLSLRLHTWIRGSCV